TGDTRDAASFRRRALGPTASPTPLNTVELDLVGLGFPPNELAASIAVCWVRLPRRSSTSTPTPRVPG
ncbi:hypothetical protein C6A85_67390, partial [Mycobacterium sp. ITM-2017-0098]